MLSCMIKYTSKIYQIYIKNISNTIINVIPNMYTIKTFFLQIDILGVFNPTSGTLTFLQV